MTAPMCTWPGPAQPGQAPPHPARPHPARPGSAQPGEPKWKNTGLPDCEWGHLRSVPRNCPLSLGSRRLWDKEVWGFPRGNKDAAGNAVRSLI